MEQKKKIGYMRVNSREQKDGKKTAWYPEVYLQWSKKEITLRQAAALCHLAETTFFDKAKNLCRKENPYT